MRLASWESGMTVSGCRWLVRDRRRFIEVLTETGNPAMAAAEINMTLDAVYTARERSPEFAREWRRALGIAWEQVEMRVLSSLLDDGGKVDARTALAMLKRRPAALAAAPVTIDAAVVAQVREKIRALAPPKA